MEISNSRVFAAEVVGTAVLMLGGPGSAILAGDSIGTLGIALAFGFSLLVMAYAIGHVTGCNINPAVTLGMVLTRKLTWAQAVFYWVGQFVGAAIGGVVIYAIANNIDGFSSKNNFAANGWDQYSPGGYGIVAAMFVEVVFTALLVYVVLATTSGRFPVGFGGLAAGLALALIHLVTIPVDNTSVNPARSFGSALFAGPDALGQLWLFLVFPMIGAAVGALIWIMLDEARLEDTMFAEVPGATEVRDAVDKLDDRLDDVGQARPDAGPGPAGSPGPAGLGLAVELRRQVVRELDPHRRHAHRVTEHVAVHLEGPLDRGHLLGRPRRRHEAGPQIDALAGQRALLDLDDAERVRQHDLDAARAGRPPVPGLGVQREAVR